MKPYFCLQKQPHEPDEDSSVVPVALNSIEPLKKSGKSYLTKRRERQQEREENTIKNEEQQPPPES